MIVCKFGGVTLSTPEWVDLCLDRIEHLQDRQPILVVSAHGKITDQLVEAAKEAQQGRVRLGNIREYHLDLADALDVSHSMLNPLLDQLLSLLHGIALLKELTPRTMDHVMSFGERLSVRMIAGALTQRGIRALPVNAFDVGLITDDNFGAARPLPSSEAEVGAKLRAMDCMPVVTGFLGKNQAGEITTLGRSGSDYTATYVAAAVGAEEVLIFKAVDGVMTSDPGVVDGALNVPEMSFAEASELAYFGAEVLHPAAILPAIDKDIPVRVINAKKEGDRGTIILSRPVVSSRMAKAVVYKEDVTLYHMTSPRMHAAAFVLNDALRALADVGIAAHMVSTSSAGISIIAESGLDERRTKKPCAILEKIATTKCHHRQAIICMIGDELRGRHDAVARVFQVLSDAGINARVITRSASEINLAFLVANDEILPAVKALHQLLLASC